MKILGLQVQGFRSLFNIVWKPGDLNIVIGPNGSGKSNLLKALAMLSQSAIGKLGFQMFHEGGMDSVVYSEPNGAISFKLISNANDGGGPEGHENLTYQLDLCQIESSSVYKIDYEYLGDLPQFGRHFKTSPEYSPDSQLKSEGVVGEIHRKILISQEMMNQEESILSSTNNLPNPNLIIARYQKWLSQWQIFHDFQTHSNAPARQAVFAKVEIDLAPDGSNLVTVLNTLYENYPDFRNYFNRAMQSAFDKDFVSLAFPTVGLQKVQMQVNWRSCRRPQTSAMLSEGALRYIYLITILANPKHAPLIAIDEPETGLHSSLLPIIAEYVRKASRQTQIILTTHSVELLEAFSSNRPTITIVKNKDGKTYLDTLEGESLRYWMKDNFFHKSFGNEMIPEMSLK